MGIKFYGVYFKQFGDALYIVAAERAANVIRVVVGSKCRGEFVTLFINVVDHAVYVPRWVNNDNFSS